ncbi:MAG: peptidoglycan-binding protein [Actinobacteria bacterium]|nr:peptidoglycan-binding protein [Actinomycetota bacterium]
MSYNWNFNSLASTRDNWNDMKSFINSKKPKEVINIMDFEFNYVKPGSKNEETRAIQQIMIDEGYDLGSYGADGIYGAKTKEAILKWQTDNGLKVDGIVGRETWQWILENLLTGKERFLQLIVRKANFK